IWYNAQLEAALRDAKEAKARVEEARTRIEERELSVRRHLYAYDLKAVKQAWDKDDVARVLELLNSHRPQAGQEDIRGFEWFHLWKLCHGQLFTLRTAGGQCAYSPDGRTLVTTGSSSVQLWDAATGKLLHTWATPKGDTPEVLAFAPNGKSLAAGGKTV